MLRYKSNTTQANRDRILNIITRTKGTSKRGRTNGACVSVNGEWSCGKTLFLAFVAVERNEYEGLPVVSNYRIRGLYPWYQLTENIEMIKKIRNVILQIDEIRRYMDSYLTQSKQARFISNLTADLGKQSCDFYYTDQSPTAAPTRVRNNISLVVYPRYDEMTDWVTVYCFYGIQEYMFVEPFFRFGFYAPDYWYVYDTEQKIEDYKLKFPVVKMALRLVQWRKRMGYIDMPFSKSMVNLWNLEQGESLSGSEQSAVMTYLDAKGYD